MGAFNKNKFEKFYRIKIEELLDNHLSERKEIIEKYNDKGILYFGDAVDKFIKHLVSEIKEIAEIYLTSMEDSFIEGQKIDDSLTKDIIAQFFNSFNLQFKQRSDTLTRQYFSTTTSQELIEQSLIKFSNKCNRIKNIYKDKIELVIESHNEGCNFTQKKNKQKETQFIDSVRIKQLEEINSDNFDFRKLIQICNELNDACKNESYFSLAILTRSLVDHIPPIFNCNSFSGVANNYHGSKSFKESMRHLDNSLRKIADSHLHTHIRRQEVILAATIPRIALSEQEKTDKCKDLGAGCANNAKGCIATDTYPWPDCRIACAPGCEQEEIDCPWEG